jgi:hypothetical protein
MTLAWDIPLPVADKLLLLALADQANDEGCCWPKVSTLATKCGLEDRSARRVLGRLVEAGHITAKQRTLQTTDGRVLNTSNLYRVHLVAPPPDPGSAPPTVSVPPGRTAPP